MTQAHIADLVGVSRQTLAAWKRSGMDTSESNLPALREKAGISKVRGEIGREIQEARLRKLNAEAAAKEHALEVERGKWILADDARAMGIRAGVASRGAWEALEDSLPPFLEGLEALAMKSRIREYVRMKCLELSEIFRVTPS